MDRLGTLRGTVVVATTLMALWLTVISRAGAQSSPEWNACEDYDGVPRQRIIACTAIIERGRESKKNLARAHGARERPIKH